MLIGRQDLAVDGVGDVIDAEDQDDFPARYDPAAWRGRSAAATVTIWLAPVSSTVACRRASEQTWIAGFNVVPVGAVRSSSPQ